MEDEARPESLGGDYWDFIAAETKGNEIEDFWRAHLKALYQKLLDTWRKGARPGRTLKTDLYDEAVSRHGLIPLFGDGCEQIVGTDVSLLAAHAAKQNGRQACRQKSRRPHLLNPRRQVRESPSGHGPRGPSPSVQCDRKVLRLLPRIRPKDRPR